MMRSRPPVRWLLPLVAWTCVAGSESPFLDVTVPCGSTNVRWRDAPLTDFGPRLVTFDRSGMRTLRQAPPVGEHPRIFVSNADLPALRQRLTTSESGRLMWKYVLAWTECLKGRYDRKADYCTPDYWNGWSGWVHGPVPLMPLGERGNDENWRKLLASDLSANADGTRWNVFAIEAFRCWVADDAVGAADLAKATMTALRIGQEQRRAEAAKDPKLGMPDTPVGGVQLAHVYDFLFRWLTPQQRAAIHDELATTSARGAPYATFEDATAARSTWATFCHHVIPLLAIEGEPGCNDLKLAACYRAWRNYLTYSINRSGCIYEGEGKLILGAAAVMAFSQRPQYDCLGAHPHLRRYADYFLPHAAVADRTGFFAFDLLGGPRHAPNAVDVILMRYLYPEDRRIAWVYRQAMGDGYRNLPQDPAPWGEMNCLLFAAVFATDFMAGVDDPATLGLGQTFFDGERALLMTRSDWSRDATQLTMQTRQVSGGHPYADRNSIQVAGAGRVWSAVDGNEMFGNECQSVVIIDEHRQDYATPGRIVDFQDRPSATFIVGDAKYAWDWTWEDGLVGHGWNFNAEEVAAGAIERHTKPGFEPEPHCAADFHFTFRDDPAERLSLYHRPTWYGPKGWVNPTVRKPLYPVRMAFRTAGLVRGAHPYVLVVDDIQKDMAIHHYDWLLQLEPDVKAAIGKSPAGEGCCDVVLRGDLPAKPTNVTAPEPRLLVRVLERQQSPTVALNQGDAYISDLKAGSWKRDRKRLVVPSDSVRPDYKMLIVPHRAGDSLPTTRWNANHSELTIAWKDQQDVIRFSVAASGKTDVSINRQLPATGELVRVDRAITPLPDAPAEARETKEHAARESALRELTDFHPERDPDLIGYWNFEQCEKGSAIDCSPSHVELPLAGLNVTTGWLGKALTFDGRKDALPLPCRIIGRQPFSVVLWLKAPEVRDGGILSCNGANGINLFALWGTFRSSGFHEFNWGSTDRPFDATEWRQIAITWDGTTGRFFQDLKHQHEGRGICDPEGAPTIGGAGFTGQMDEIMVYKRGLTLDELTRINRWQRFILTRKISP